MKIRNPFSRTDRGPSPDTAAAPRGRKRAILLIAMVAFVLAAGISGTVISLRGPGPVTYTAYFSEAVGVYPGSNVDVLGVTVGAIDSVQPEGKDVKVVMSVDRNVTIPAGADAVVIVPSVIADRYIQLTPAYTGGAALTSGAVIPESRTATPVEIDQIYSAISKLAGDLGPNGVNKNGALSGVLNTGAANLKGNGQSLATMVDQMSQLAQTLNGTQNSFFGTVSNLQKFAGMLQSNNSQVATAQNQLAKVSGFLAADRSNLAGALSELSTALAQVQSFISGNRAGLKANITNLQGITAVLVKERASLAEALDNEPLAADNFIAAYDPSTGTLNSRDNLNELSMGSCSYISNPSQKDCPLPLPATGSTATGSSSGSSS
jgi:phospholipid/cholesterol/gamma-HCH transport system substrate-binding protein